MAISYPVSWRQLCESLDLSLSRDQTSSSVYFRDIFKWRIQDISSGQCDWRVPKLVVFVSKAVRVNASSWVITLKDESGFITGCANAGAVEEYPNILCTGSTLLLREVAIIYSGEQHCPRHLNILRYNIVAAFAPPVVVPVNAKGAEDQEIHEIESDLVSAYFNRSNRLGDLNINFPESNMRPMGTDVDNDPVSTKFQKKRSID